MLIEWKIEKKRGNVRPRLCCKITLSGFEKALAVSPLQIPSTIPKPPESFWEHCYPGERERDSWKPGEYYYLSTPSHKQGELQENFILPWREDNQYPEVEESFKLLRDEHEKLLRRAYDSRPFELEGALDITPETKRHIAPAAAAERILKVVGK